MRTKQLDEREAEAASRAASWLNTWKHMLKPEDYAAAVAIYIEDALAEEENEALLAKREKLERMLWVAFCDFESRQHS